MIVTVTYADKTTTRSMYGSGVIRVRVFNDSTATEESNVVHFAMSSPLGSTGRTVGNDGSDSGIVRYTPYGTVRTGDVANLAIDQTYTGQTNDPGTGLIDYNARQYDPVLAKFIQPDTIVPNMANPQDLNRYMYVRGNPVNVIDPSGHFGCDSGGGGIWSVVCPIIGLKEDVDQTIDLIVPEDVQETVKTGLDFSYFIGKTAATFVPGYDCYILATKGVDLGSAAGCAGDFAGPIGSGIDVLNGARKIDNALDAVDNVGDAIDAAHDLENAIDETNTLRHYTNSAAAEKIDKSGKIRPGQESGRVWLTPDEYVDGTTAQSRLALPRQPDGYYEIPACRVSCPSSPSTVQPWGGYPGGGIEIITNSSINITDLPFTRFGPR